MSEVAIEWFIGELQRVDREMKAVQQDILAATNSTNSPALIDKFKDEKARLVEEEKDLQRRLHAILASPSGDVRADEQLLVASYGVLQWLQLPAPVF